MKWQKHAARMVLGKYKLFRRITGLHDINTNNTKQISWRE
jgi:hypothetical protein